MSQFLNESSHFHSDPATELDFEDALKLHGGGSTCDIYRTKWQRREVFIKKLKKEYSSNPLYLDALDKEFEIGVKLRHPSLPNYLEFHRDYIIMEYIDGCTLKEMIRRQDPWLSNEKNIEKLMSQLINAVDYLHFHHITHCDIKGDNILITANNHDLVLIDFDKSYTDSLNDTSGDPSKYGLSSNEVGKVALDFRGIAEVAKKLKENGYKFPNYNKFIKACYKDDVTPEELNKILNYRPTGFRRGYLGACFILFILIGCIAVVWFYQWKNDEKTVSQGQQNVAPNTQDIEIIEPVKENKSNATVNENETQIASVSPVITQSELHEDAKQKAILLDKRIHPLYIRLNAGLDSLNVTRNDTSLSWQQLLTNIRAFSDKEDEYKEETFAIIYEMFPGITDREVYRILSYSIDYTEYNKRSSKELEEFGKEIEKRRQQSASSI